MISIFSLVCPAIQADASLCVSAPRRKQRKLSVLRILLAALLCPMALMLSGISGQAQQSLQVLHHHVRPAITNGQAARVGPLPRSQGMNLSIVLPLRNQDALTNLLSQIYDPSNPNYRHFLSVEEFTDQFGPTREDYQAVVNFAKANGFTVTETRANRLTVPIRGTVDQVNKAFNVSMNSYQHPTENRTFYSPDREPSLNLSVQVAHIAGLNNYSIPRPMVRKAQARQALVSNSVIGSGPGGSYLPSDMRAAYYGSGALTGEGQTVGIFEEDGYNIDDVVQDFGGKATSITSGGNYILTYTPTAGGTTYNVPINNVLVGGSNSNPIWGDDGEQALDIAQAIGMAPGLSQVRLYIGQMNNPDVDILSSMATENIAKQLSISWYWTTDDSITDDVFFQEFAAQGQSVFIASGDYGEYDPANYAYPAEDAWVTAVGGTDLTTNGAGGSWSSETAWTYSGGGISSDGIPIPSWQTGVANASNGGSTTFRNVPDVAAEANFDNYSCSMGLCDEGYGGTSFAAPRWAGFMALVNQQATAAGDPTAGFINPKIYTVGKSGSYKSYFHDIVSGNNNAENSCCGQPFYNAVSGYDLVTGWGSPTGQALINVLAHPASARFQLLASPNNLNVNPGTAGITTISVNDMNGFNGLVNLSISGLPSGVTATFAPSSTNGISQLILNVSSSAVHGEYGLTISGSSGTITTTTTLALTINAPGFSIQSYSAAYLYPGTSTGVYLPITDYAGFNGSVEFAVTSSLPAGVTASWSSNPLSTGSELLTLSASSSTVPVQTWVTVTGTSGAMSSTTTFGLSVNAPYYSLIVSPNPLTTVQGGAAKATVSVVPLGGFTGSVTLSATNLPAGVTATFTPNSTTVASTLTLHTSNSTAPGVTNISITGTSGSQSYSELIPLNIASSAPTTNDWSWMAGSNIVGSDSGVDGVYGYLGFPSREATPGSREIAATWTDSSGNLWLFGGDGRNADSSSDYLLNDFWKFIPAQNEWAWMGGSALLGSNYNMQSGVYGTLGIFNSANIPGSRSGAFTWTDSNGNLWLFGGEGRDANGNLGFLNDLWKYVPDVNIWVWMGGSNTIGSNDWAQPGVYGTLGAFAAGNIPGGRGYGMSWTDNSGHFWLFGGSGVDANGNNGDLNDLWEFNPSTNQWAWMSGSNSINQNGVYGTLGSPAAGNVPGGRSSASTWTDTNGNLWLFGGDGYDAYNTMAYLLNDLWEFNPSTNEWAWISGSNHYDCNPGCGIPGVYGTLGKPAPGNVPGSRSGSASWTDSSGNLWLFDGGGYDTNNNEGYLNDLWEFSPTTNEWAWMGGSSTIGSKDGQPGVYGTLETPAAGNFPGSRDGSPNWTDASGHFWLFGGWGLDASGTLGSLNDLWMYQPPAVLTPTAVPVFSLPARSYPTAKTLTIRDATPGATIYYSTNYWDMPAVSFNVYTGPITISSTETITAYAKASGYSRSGEAIGVYTITPPAAPIFNVPSGSYSSAQSVTISDATPGATIYYTTDGTTPTTSSTKYTGPIIVSSSETLTAIATVGNVSSTVVAATYTVAISCHINYAIASQWAGGFEAGITIVNTGTTGINNWTVTWSFANQQTITSIWSGTEVQNGANVTVTNLGYNGTIAAGASYSGIGFTGSWNNATNSAPTSFAVNGTTCK
ncbi:MAG: protease pro-enzyme activation domain-containing protein [Terracidiphilus sp.]